MTETTTTPTPETTSNADARLGKVENDLNSLETKLKRDARVTFVVALILLGLLTGYFWYGYSEFNAILQPQELVDVAAAMLDENIEPARKGLEAEIEKQAPMLAQKLSDQAVAAIPGLRESLEEYILKQSKQAVDQAVGDSTGRFDVILEQHRPEIKSLIAEMKQNDKASADVMAALEQAINDEIGQDMQANAGEVLETLNLLTDRVERLAAGRGLTDEEQLERQALMVVRRLQLEAADPSLDMKGEFSSPVISTEAIDTRKTNSRAKGDSKARPPAKKKKSDDKSASGDPEAAAKKANVKPDGSSDGENGRSKDSESKTGRPKKADSEKAQPEQAELEKEGPKTADTERAKASGTEEKAKADE